MKSVFEEKFYEALIERLEDGSISFSEPDLTKIFLKYLDLNFPYGIKSKATLTQSNKKWMASKYKNGPLAEIGDLLLICQRGTEFKYSFIQAKLIRDIDSKLKSFKGNVHQHYLMSGDPNYIYFMGKDKTDNIHKSRHKSITNYLVFYRTRNSSKKYVYNAFLSSAKGNCKLLNKSKVNYKNFAKSHKKNRNEFMKSITIQRKKDGKKILYARKDPDMVSAKNYDDIINGINNFSIGAPLDFKAFMILGQYLSEEIVDHICKTTDYLFNSQMIKNREANLPISVLIDVSDC